MGRVEEAPSSFTPTVKTKMEHDVRRPIHCKGVALIAMKQYTFVTQSLHPNGG